MQSGAENKLLISNEFKQKKWFFIAAAHMREYIQIERTFLKYRLLWMLQFLMTAHGSDAMRSAHMHLHVKSLKGL